jgi:hypothetical protein
VIPNYQYPRLAVEEFTDDIGTEIPQLGNLAHRIVALLKARWWRFIRTI